MRLVFLGPPGAGKGTQAVRLAEKLGVPHISTGAILRDAIERGTPTGLEAKSYVENGQLVPSDVVLRLVRDRLSEPDAAEGWILDGYPRNLDQAEAFAAITEELSAPLDRVVYIEVADDSVVKRLSGRRQCRTCDRIYHIEYSPPEGGRCGDHEADLYQRADDTEEAIRQRLAVYRGETEPLVAHYAGTGQLLKINGAQQVDDVYASIEQGLGS